MPTVPTSPLRVVPQAPAVDPRLFTQVPSVQEGLQMFEAGAKLPLILENIKHEKKRIKMENSKLDFAMSEAGRLQEQQGREMAMKAAALDIAAKQSAIAKDAAQTRLLESQASGDLAVLAQREAKAKADKAEADAEAAKLAAKTAAEGNKPLADVGVNYGEVQGVPTEGVGGEGAPLGDATLGDRLIAGSAVPEQPQQPPVNYVPSFTKTPDNQFAQLVNMPADSASINALATDMRNTAVARRFPFGVRVNNAEELTKLTERYKPSAPEDMSFGVDDNNFPIVAPVIKVDGKPVALAGPPRLDLSKRSTSQVKRDDKFAEALGETMGNPSLRANAAMNVQRLKTAAEVLSQTKDEFINGSRIIALLPESMQRLFAPEKSYARDQVRTVIQQQLRATLGAQFARVEGEMMMDRAFSPLFESELNLELIAQTAAVAESALNEAVRRELYFENNGGTLMGYKPSVDLSEGGEVTQQIKALIKQKPATLGTASSGDLNRIAGKLTKLRSELQKRSQLP